MFTASSSLQELSGINAEAKSVSIFKTFNFTRKQYPSALLDVLSLGRCQGPQAFFPLARAQKHVL